MAIGKKRNPKLVHFSDYIDKDLYELIKQLSREKSAELGHLVSINALATEALWDLAEKYGKVKPDERPSEEGAAEPAGAPAAGGLHGKNLE